MSETASAKAKSETKTQTKKQSGQPSLNMAELRELAELVNEHGFTDFEFENANIRVRLSKQTAPIMQSVQHVSAPTPVTAPQVSATPQTENATVETPVDADAGLHKITSPIVGTFYSSPAPDKDAYVSLGDKVSENTTVCIVEAMKLMNEIQAEVSGEVVKIYVENGQPVEYAQPLFGIKK